MLTQHERDVMWPYVEDSCRLITEVKQHRDWLTLGWVTDTVNHTIPNIFYFNNRGIIKNVLLLFIY